VYLKLVNYNGLPFVFKFRKIKFSRVCDLDGIAITINNKRRMLMPASFFYIHRQVNACAGGPPAIGIKKVDCN